MAQNDTVWGIDIGQCALKALKLRSIEGELRVEAFDVIDHPKILSQPDADRDQLIRNALEQFLARNNVTGSGVAVSAPGQTGFTRFVKLPPVESKQVPEIVRFEAEQQIPFDINDVIWRWQTFLDPDSPDIEVGIFAMKRPDVAVVLEAFDRVGINVDMVQMAPLALYNFTEFDGQSGGEQGATLLVDVGADKTDLVIADGPRIWTRTLQLGGNNFTDALVKVFKLSFSKAEKLKRTAATSKYARQIFQAMRPVFAELVQEIQRSIGYYTSLHRESHFRRVIGLGNGFRLPGLQKFLEQNLNIPVLRIDSYNKISPSATVNAPAFTENVLSFAVAYGLALQGLGLTKIKINLLPSEIARQRLWSGKWAWFAASAAVLVLGFATLAYSAYRRQEALDPGRSAALSPVRNVIRAQKDWRAKFIAVKGRAEQEAAKILPYNDMCAYRDFWPTLLGALDNAIAKVATDQALLNPKGLAALRKKARTSRRTISVKDVRAQYEADVQSASMNRRMGIGSRSTGAARPPRIGMGGMDVVGGMERRAPAQLETAVVAKPKRGYILFLEGTTPLPRRDVTDFLYQIVNTFKAEAATLTRPNANEPELEKRRILFSVLEGTVEFLDVGDARISSGPDVYDRRRSEKDAFDVDPLTGEDMTEDTRFMLKWKVAITEPEPPGAAGGPAGARTGGVR